MYADTIVCGFDGNTSAISAIKDGSLGMDIAQLGYDMGYKAVEAAVKALEGEQVDSFIDSGSKVVDSANSFGKTVGSDAPTFLIVPPRDGCTSYIGKNQPAG